MKISLTPTDHLLVRAQCQSEWDNCDFAIITCGESWKELMRKRLEAAVSFFADYDFEYFSYRDDSTEFYASQDDEIENMFAETDGKEWTFVRLDKDEEESFSRPENHLESYSSATPNYWYSALRHRKRKSCKISTPKKNDSGRNNSAP